MTLHILLGMLWPILYPTVCSIVTTRKGVCKYHYIVCLRSCLSSVVLRGPPVVRLSNASSHGFTWVLRQNGGINLAALCYPE